jgi:hypothetical protein
MGLTSHLLLVLSGHHLMALYFVMADELGLVLFRGGIGYGQARLSQEGLLHESAGVDDKPFRTGK